MKQEDLNIIVKIRFGSNLYGTNTPDSDEDFLGVYLPTKEQILLQRVDKSVTFNDKKSDGERNTSGDVDCKYYSLHHFIKLACEGQTEAIDMLHAPDNMIIEKNYIWDLIVYHRDKFYTRNLKAFVGYAQKQAAKYGIRGSRLNTCKEVMDLLKLYETNYRNEPRKVREIWELLPDLEHTQMLGENKNGIREYKICGKIIQETVTCTYAYGILEKYG